jgi:hypothetical protein
VAEIKRGAGREPDPPRINSRVVNVRCFV